MKIHLCGTYGSGKSTLAKILSEKLQIPFFSLDDIKYKVKYTEIRSVEERVNSVKKICSKKNWITEGTWSGYAEDAFKKSDIIIFMLIPKITCSYRVLKRFFTRKKMQNDTLKGASGLIKEIYKYHSTNQPVSKIEHVKLIKKYNKKVIIIRNNKDLKKLESVNSIYRF